MKKLLYVIVASALFLLFTSVKVNAQSSGKPYKEGTVWRIQYIKTKPGMGQMYLKDLSTHWVKVVEAAKKRGLITDYKVLISDPGSQTDWDLMLLVEHKNYADLDGMSDKVDALAKELLGTEDAQHQSAVSRNAMRDILGGKLAQELIFK